jgi:predicted phosphodiesterase
MKMHVLADLHLEFGPVSIPTPDADVVVLAGDVHLGDKGLKWINKHFAGRPVVYVLGNHEFYHHSLPELTQTLKRKTEGSHIHLLENAAVELCGFTFLGCTLWTSFTVGPDPAAAMQTAESQMNDYHIIQHSTENRVLRAADTIRLHQESVAWLKDALRQHDPARTVVVTHHAPSLKSEAPYHANSPLTPSFISDLDSLIEQSKVPLWIHGHTHYNVDYRIGSTRVFSNQCGYPRKGGTNFDPALVVEVSSEGILE